jgi:hypothetical protein
MMIEGKLKQKINATAEEKEKKKGHIHIML